MARVVSVVQTEPPIRPFAAVVRKLAVAGRACGKCRSTEIRPSNSRNALDILLACVFLTPFRCRICRDRFYRFWRPGLMNVPEPSSEPLVLIPFRRDLSALRRVGPVSIESLVAEPDSPQEKPAEIQMLPSQPTLATVPDPILILESDLSIRKLLRRLLERRGYVIVEIAQAEGLDLELRNRRAGLLIVDTSTVEGSGVEALVALAHVHPSLKILALSTDSFQGHEIPGRLLALPKPFSLDRFVDCVDRLLKRPAAATAGR